ncbi:DUF6912 family protein [Georgenia sp. Z1344]|uniref:DUF6912 family protein n=1 Tax=Georgenia sp. Z1344 TaxID=3416706 RepID=UPI003CE74D23
MRIYLPATPAELAADPAATRAHAVTADLVSAVPDEDEEGLEVIALLAAADDSVRRLAELGEGPPARRVVLAADVPEGSATPEPGDLPSLVRLDAPIGWESVAAIHVDEESAEVEVAAAVAGDDDAFERVAELDLLWFDPSERAAILGA